jgi:hypothetical protein
MKQICMFGTLLAAMITVACEGAQNSLSPTAPSAANQGSKALNSGANQAAVPDCTPPEGADVHFEPAPSGSVPGTDQPSCETGNEDGSGPGLNTGGTPPTNPSGPPQGNFRPRP